MEATSSEQRRSKSQSRRSGVEDRRSRASTPRCATPRCATPRCATSVSGSAASGQDHIVKRAASEKSLRTRATSSRRSGSPSSHRLATPTRPKELGQPQDWMLHAAGQSVDTTAAKRPVLGKLMCSSGGPAWMLNTTSRRIARDQGGLSDFIPAPPERLEPAETRAELTPDKHTPAGHRIRPKQKAGLPHSDSRFEFQASPSAPQFMTDATATKMAGRAMDNNPSRAPVLDYEWQHVQQKQAYFALQLSCDRPRNVDWRRKEEPRSVCTAENEGPSCKNTDGAGVLGARTPLYCSEIFKEKPPYQPPARRKVQSIQAY